MSSENEETVSPSYFWSCITLKDDCPFWSSLDPNLIYFGVGLFGFYAAFVLMIFADLNCYWSLDKFQNQIDYYINLVRKKVRKVQMDQRRLMSTQERTEKQLKRSQQCQRIILSLRSALNKDETQQLSIMAAEERDSTPISTRRATWSECHSITDF